MELHQIGRLKFREVKDILIKNGFKELRQNGSHVIFESPTGHTVSIPSNKGDTVNKHILKKIFKKHNIIL